MDELKYSIPNRSGCDHSPADRLDARPCASADQTYLGQRLDALRNIEEIRVLVEDMDDVQNYSAQRIQTAVELKLRQNGITVPAPSVEGYTLYPYLYVNANVMKLNERNSDVYGASIEFKRLVTFRGGPDKDFLAFGALWNKGFVGITPSTEPDTICDAVLELVDNFLNDYLSVNPRR